MHLKSQVAYSIFSLKVHIVDPQLYPLDVCLELHLCKSDDKKLQLSVCLFTFVGVFGVFQIRLDVDLVGF